MRAPAASSSARSVSRISSGWSTPVGEAFPGQRGAADHQQRRRAVGVGRRLQPAGQPAELQRPLRQPPGQGAGAQRRDEGQRQRAPHQAMHSATGAAAGVPSRDARPAQRRRTLDRRRASRPACRRMTAPTSRTRASACRPTGRRRPMPAAAERLVERFAALGAGRGAAGRRRSGPAPCCAAWAATARTSPTSRCARRRRCARWSHAGPERAGAAGDGARSPACPVTAPRAQLAADAARGQARRRAGHRRRRYRRHLGARRGSPRRCPTSPRRRCALAVAHLLRAAHDAGELRLPHPGRSRARRRLHRARHGQARRARTELFQRYRPRAAARPGRRVSITATPTRCASTTRLARGLVSLMEARDADGYVFRTDLRLRPDPAATPPVHRPAGRHRLLRKHGPELGTRGHDEGAPGGRRPRARRRRSWTRSGPFVWRRRLDFAAVADIHAMKRRIDAAQGHRRSAPQRGSGGAHRRPQRQARPGRHPRDRVHGADPATGLGRPRPGAAQRRARWTRWRCWPAPATCRARAAGELGAAYRFLRRVEHRLQMVADRQTHALPEQPAAAGGASPCSWAIPTPPRFAAALLRHLTRVQRALPRGVRARARPAEDGARRPALDFSGTDEPPPATVAALRRAWAIADTGRVVEAVRGWPAGRVRALRSQRARDLMQQRAARPAGGARRARPQPDAAFARFDAFLGRLPAGVQLLSLFQRNPALLDRVAGVLGAAPSLADYLARTRRRWRGCWRRRRRGRPRPACCARRLADARGAGGGDRASSAAPCARRISPSRSPPWRGGSMPTRPGERAHGAGRCGAGGAAAARCWPISPRRFGRVRGGAHGGGAAGQGRRAGDDGRLRPRPDADLRPSGGRDGKPRRRAPLPASQWFIRAVHAYRRRADRAGRGRADVRRGHAAAPVRQQGPGGGLARRRSSATTQPARHGGAWTWERMALTRARVVAGPPALRARVEAAIRAAIANAGPPARIRADAAAMRARLLRDLPPGGPWDVKLRPGGQIEVEFIAQALQLVHAPPHPGVLQPDHARTRWPRLRDAGLLPAGRRRAADPRRPGLAHACRGCCASPMAARRPAKLSEAAEAALLRAVAAAGIDPAPVDVAGAARHLGDAGAGCARRLRAACGRDRVMSVQEGDAAPAFLAAGERRAHGQQRGAEGQAVHAVFLSEGRHVRLHQGGLRLPGGAAAAGQDRPGGDRRVARPDEADREIRRQIQPDLPAGLRRDQGGRRGLRRVGREIDVRQEIHGHRALHVPGRRARQDRAGLAQGEGGGHAKDVAAAAAAL